MDHGPENIDSKRQGYALGMRLRLETWTKAQRLEVQDPRPKTCDPVSYPKHKTQNLRPQTLFFQTLESDLQLEGIWTLS